MSVFKNCLKVNNLRFALRKSTHFEGAYFKRNYLSEAYKCKEAWNLRLQTSLLSNIKIEELFIELDKRLALRKKISCVDVDLFACGINSSEHLVELENILHRFRQTKATVNTLESTSTAVVRIFLEHDRLEDLIKILHNRRHYGIFPDLFSYNLLIDHFLKQKKYQDAVKVAVLMMLQEDFNNPISKILVLYSCHMYLREPQSEPWYPETQKEEIIEEKKAGDEEEEEEDVYVRVPFLRNPSFDDHFDIVNPQHLVGKTMYTLGKEINDAVGNSYQLVGLGLYQKWQKASELLDKFIQSKESALIYTEMIAEFEKQLIPAEGDDTSNQIKLDLQRKIDVIKSSNKTLMEELNPKLVEKLETIGQLESVDIETQKKMFKDWEVIRANALEKDIEEMRILERKAFIINKKKELHEKEQLLFFFENWNKHEMELAEIEAEEKANPTVSIETEEYIPPEIVKKQKQR